MKVGRAKKTEVGGSKRRTYIVVTRFLHAVADRVELVGEVRTAGLGGVELRARKGRGSDATTQGMGSEFECEGATHVRLDEHRETASNDPVCKVVYEHTVSK